MRDNRRVNRNRESEEQRNLSPRDGLKTSSIGVDGTFLGPWEPYRCICDEFPREICTFLNINFRQKSVHSSIGRRRQSRQKASLYIPQLKGGGRADKKPVRFDRQPSSPGTVWVSGVLRTVWVGSGVLNNYKFRFFSRPLESQSFYNK